MRYLLVRHKVRDFASWKNAYAAHKAKRDEAGLRETHLLRNADDPSEVVILFETTDDAKARAFVDDSDLAAVMKDAGVTDQPDLYFLE